MSSSITPGKKQLFRPCIDLHEGKVKQLVGSSLAKKTEAEGVQTKKVQTNFIATRPPRDYADIFQSHNLVGGHIVMLGGEGVGKNSNAVAAMSILKSSPGVFHLGGGIHLENGKKWLDAGARKLIITSAMFDNGLFSLERANALEKAFGKERLVVDISSKRLDTAHLPLESRYQIMLQGWSMSSDLFITSRTLKELARYASEFLVHAIAREGLKEGIDEELIGLLADISPLPTVYAGGVSSLADVESIKTLGRKRIGFTIGSALDLYGGTLPLDEVLEQGVV